MRIIFFGTPEFAVPSLRVLLGSEHRVVVAITQPDRPQGRSRSELVPPPVKREAEAAGVPVLQPERPIGDKFVGALRALHVDLGVVVAYGHILRPVVLEIPRLGMINVHASLLPRLRGAAPIQHAILAGDDRTGVSIMQMEAGLDSGPVYLRRETPIADDETAGALATRLADLGAAALVEALPGIAAGTARAEPQDDALATLAPKIGRETARLTWTDDAGALARRVRAFDPAPGAWTRLGESEVKLFGARTVLIAGEPPALAPGTVLEAGEKLVIATGRGGLEVSEVQPAGKRRMPVAAWVRGRGVEARARFT